MLAKGLGRYLNNSCLGYNARLSSECQMVREFDVFRYQMRTSANSESWLR